VEKSCGYYLYQGSPETARLYEIETEGVFDMKATGIVRRIDDYVIIGSSSESLENTVVSLILSNFTNKWRHSE
jgi:hypothetical protein